METMVTGSVPAIRKKGKAYKIVTKVRRGGTDRDGQFHSGGLHLMDFRNGKGLCPLTIDQFMEYFVYSTDPTCRSRATWAELKPQFTLKEIVEICG